MRFLLIITLICYLSVNASDSKTDSLQRTSIQSFPISENREVMSLPEAMHAMSNMPIVSYSDTALLENPEKVVDQQLKAFNSRDLEAYVEAFSDDIEIYLFPNQLVGKGKVAIRNQYGPMFEQLTDLHCEIKNRIAIGNKVVDHEFLTGMGQPESMVAIVIYEVAEGKITKMYLVQ